MYCYNCGEFFPEDERVLEKDCNGQITGCCPACGSSDIGESEICYICGNDFPEGETRNGFCLCCLWEAIDYDVALEYMKGDDYFQLTEFILNDWLGGMLDGGITNKLGQFMEETFRRLVADEKLRMALSQAEEPKFLEACRVFCLPFYHNGDFGCEGQTFAEWYAGYIKKEAAK